jgi:hypothetical protein
MEGFTGSAANNIGGQYRSDHDNHFLPAAPPARQEFRTFSIVDTLSVAGQVAAPLPASEAKPVVGSASAVDQASLCRMRS